MFCKNNYLYDKLESLYLKKNIFKYKLLFWREKKKQLYGKPHSKVLLYIGKCITHAVHGVRKNYAISALGNCFHYIVGLQPE